MELEIQGQKCKKYISVSSYKKRSVHISLFIGSKDKNSFRSKRPRSSVMTYVQRKVFTPTISENVHKEVNLSPFYMPKMMKSPSPVKGNRFYSSKCKVNSILFNEQPFPAEQAIKNASLANKSVTKDLNLSLNIGKIQASPQAKPVKFEASKLKSLNFKERLNFFINTLKK